MGGYTDYPNLNKKKSVGEKKSKSPMLEMLDLLKEVEELRDKVEKKQADLDSAIQELKRAEKKVSDQIEKLDPNTRARLRSIMGGLNEKGPEGR